MRYVVMHQGREHMVELHTSSTGVLEAVVDGVRHVVDAKCLTHGFVNVVVDGRVHDVDVDGLPPSPQHADGALRVRLRGQEMVIAVVEEQRKRLRDASRKQLSHDGAKRVCSPMPGKIIKVLAQLGSDVKVGQGLVVVEAMKMENELRATTHGKVMEVRVVEGQPVEGGAVLMVLE